MQPFVSVTGPTVPLPFANIDTDVIMPKQFLKGIDRAGLNAGAFYDLRFDSAGQIRQDCLLNRSAWRDARFLVVGPNFGCGSSREHAVWGLLQLGIRAVLGTSFAGIFADNAANNGLLLVSLTAPQVIALTERASDPERNCFTVDLQGEIVTAPGLQLAFSIDPLRREMLTRGLDLIGSTLEHAGAIRAFQDVYLAANPWLA
jgi:3-isopropylmalate/(R)-2-methylmalate dehydratase small subunit